MAMAPTLDGRLLPGAEGTGSHCFLGMAFRGGFQGVITQLRFFMDYFSDASKYAGNLVLQGSNYPF